MEQTEPTNHRTILIVEDEALIRFHLADFFADAGYRVSEAASADEAIAILDRDGSIRVVLTDVQMPGSMDGLKLAHYVRDRFPPAVLVVTLGVLSFTASELPAESFFVSKPFDPRRVLDRIERLAA